MDKEKIINRIKEFKNANNDSELEYFVQSLGNGACICILRGGLDKPDPEEYMNDVVLSVVQKEHHNSFIEAELDNPYVKIIIFDLNNIPFEEKSNEKACRK